MGITTYVPGFEEREYTEVRTAIPTVKVTAPTTYRPPTRDPYITSGSYSGVGSGRSSSRISPTQKISEIKKEEPKPIPIPKLPPSQKQRRERDLISRQLRIKGRIQKVLKRQIIYSPKSEIEYEKKTIQERFKEKKRQIIEKQIKEKKIKVEQRKKEYNDKELKKRLKTYQLYLQQKEKEKEKPLPIKIEEEIPEEKSIKKIKWW